MGEDDEEEEEGEETESTRTKCAAQGREHKRWAIEGTKRWRGEEKRAIGTWRKTLSARDHLEAPHSTLSLVNNHQKRNSVESRGHFLLQYSAYLPVLASIKDTFICTFATVDATLSCSGTLWESNH